MAMSAPSNWKWPNKRDTMWYGNDDEIDGIDAPKPINTRCIFSVPEIKKYLS